MRSAPLALLALAGCLASESEDRWRYQSVMWERAPEIRSGDDVRARADDLRGRRELTLDDCYELTLARSISVMLQGEELVRIQTLFEQTVATVLPRLAFRGSYTRQEEVDAQTGSDVRQSFTEEERTEYRFTARQPLFSGLRDYYAVRQGAALYAAKEHDLRQARLALYRDVAEVFYSILQLDRELATTRDALALARERLDELTQRQRVGISRRSEVLAQEAEAASIEAGVERLRGALEVAWEALKFLTGLPAPRPLRDALPELPALLPVEEYVARSRARRSDLRSLQEQLAAAEHSVGVARAGYLPTVTLDANYYTHREGISEDVDWDVVVAAEFPLFDGFATQARIREAYSNVRSVRLRHEELLRTSELDVRRAHADVVALRAQLRSLEKAVASAQESHDLVQAEYRQGIVTNIEVLTVFTTLQTARLERDRARYQLKQAQVRLAVASGLTPEEIHR